MTGNETYWLDTQGRRVTLSVGLACYRGRGGRGCVNRFFLLSDGGALRDPDVSRATSRAQAELIVDEYARAHGWSKFAGDGGLFGTEEVDL